MRSYPIDSPKAMSRLLALAMIADGCMAPQELKTLHRSRVLDALGVSEDTFDATAGELTQDLQKQAAGRDTGMVEIEADTLDALLREVQTPALQAQVLHGMQAIVHADHLIDNREHRLLRRAMLAWGNKAGGLPVED